MSQCTFKKLVKEKTNIAGLKYLLGQKQKQTKTSNIQYNNLKSQEYLLPPFPHLAPTMLQT